MRRINVERGKRRSNIKRRLDTSRFFFLPIMYVKNDYLHLILSGLYIKKNSKVAGGGRNGC